MPPPQYERQEHHSCTGEIGDAVDDIVLVTRQIHSSTREVATSRGATSVVSDNVVLRNDPTKYGDDSGPNDTPIPLIVKDDTSVMSEILSDGGAVEGIHCSCTALWILEHEDPRVGGAVRTRSLWYRLRQACTNLYLSVIGSAVDAFFFDENRCDEEMVELPGVTGAIELNEDRSLGDGNEYKPNVRATTLCMIPPPQSKRELQSTLFTVVPTFASNRGFFN